MRGRLFVGTSGWVYKEWAGVFYPRDLKKSGELAHYATVFNTVEINATFYRLPLPGMVKGWYQRSPKDFIFTAKGSRYITHIKRLKPPIAAVRKYFSRIKLLNEKCGSILWQLPPNFDVKNLARLDTFLTKLPVDYRHAVEFRHPSWYETDETFAVLRRHKAAHVSISSLRMPMNFTVTADFVYFRFHGLKGGPRHDYQRRELKPWAEQGCDCLAKGRDVFAYFNNDLNTRAPNNAILFRTLVGSNRQRGKNASTRLRQSHKPRKK